MKKVFSLLLALLMVLSLMPQFALPAKAAVELEKLQYDDHVDLSGYAVRIVDAGIDQNSGKAVVTLRGNELIATGIGTARVSVGGVIRTVTVTKAKLNLIMIMGQSNSGNHFENATSDVTCLAGTAYWWGNEQGTAAAEPVPYTQPSMGFHAPLLAELYAQSVAAGAPVKNVLIWQEGITSKDGQSITKWARSATDTSGTNDAVTMLENCRSYYQSRSDRYEIVSSGVYWLQGETDTSMDPALYTQRFMAMWKRLKNAGMEYLAFLRVRRNVGDVPTNKDDLSYSSSLSAQIKMINDNPEFYMATTVTENWIGTPTVTHTVDISNYITMMDAYGRSASYTDQYGNTATCVDGKLTTTMKSLYGSNNTCHYGKFGYGIIGADAAYNMYRALNGNRVAMVVTDTSGHASSVRVLKNGQSVTVDISELTDNLSIRPDCGSTAGILKFVVRSGITDITNREGVVVSTGEKYGSISTSALRSYRNVSIVITYTPADGVHTGICNVQSDRWNRKKITSGILMRI
jgi:tRNA(Leu) C34 or U34 (ribose-2'-O)-methylase TrmL